MAVADRTSRRREWRKQVPALYGGGKWPGHVVAWRKVAATSSSRSQWRDVVIHRKLWQNAVVADSDACCCFRWMDMKCFGSMHRWHCFGCCFGWIWTLDALAPCIDGRGDSRMHFLCQLLPTNAYGGMMSSFLSASPQPLPASHDGGTDEFPPTLIADSTFRQS
jgi:hypothetical protein